MVTLSGFAKRCIDSPSEGGVMNARRLAWAVLAALGLAVAPAWAGDAKTGFLNKTFKDKDGSEAPYVLFVPHDYKGEKDYPVILFLHGAGETKGGSKQPVEVGIGPAIKKQEKTFPFIVVIPQSQKRTWKSGTDDANRALAILAEVQKGYKTDSNRVYLTGLSMGGFGTWSLAAAYPEKWAAIVPICGGGNPKEAAKFKDIPCWCFHGDADTAVKVDLSRAMIKALKAAGAEPRYDEYKGVGHNSWDRAYGTPGLYTWLLEQKRK
jgi:predicted peptidase